MQAFRDEAGGCLVPPQPSVLTTAQETQTLLQESPLLLALATAADFSSWPFEPVAEPSVRHCKASAKGCGHVGLCRN